MTLADLNALEPSRFAAALAGVFEHSPWIAASACDRRPFRTIDELHAALVEVMDSAPADAQLALLRAHPELARKAAMRGELSAESNREQESAAMFAEYKKRKENRDREGALVRDRQALE